MKSIEIEVRTPSEMLPLLAEYEQHMDAVQNRAYHLFEERGAGHGQDLDDWMQAQAQTLCLPQAQTSEDEARYVVATSLTGFTADLIRVIVSPQDMVLRAEAGIPRRKNHAAFTLKAITYYRFPHPVDTAGVAASLTDGLLHVAVPKHPPPAL